MCPLLAHQGSPPPHSLASSLQEDLAESLRGTENKSLRRRCIGTRSCKAASHINGREWEKHISKHISVKWGIGILFFLCFYRFETYHNKKVQFFLMFIHL